MTQGNVRVGFDLIFILNLIDIYLIKFILSISHI